MNSGSSDDAWRPPVVRDHVETLAGYTDLVEVGRGGDSIVYRGTQASLHRDVAIKVLLVDDPARAARFAREVSITVDLGRQHPNIVTVLATGTTDSGRPAIVMDYFDGGTLHDRLKSHGALSAEEVGRIGAVLADALSFAHERGILHRDVKPQNVLVLPTSWVLADFGIARLADSEHTASVETFTYRHASPQILDGQAPTTDDDIWSLGSTLYTLLDGRPPFASDEPDEDSALAYLRRARTEAHRPLTAPGTEQIAPIIDRCLSKDIDERWATAAELRDAFLGLRTSAWEPGGVAVVHAPAPKVEDAAPPAPAPAVAAPPPVDAPVEPVLTRAPAEPLVEPSPVAHSAISHVARAVDVEPTGRGVPDDHTGPDPRSGDPKGRGGKGDDGADVEEDAEPRRRRLPLILGVSALTIGLVLGIVGAALRGGDDDPPAPQPTSSGAVVELPTAPTDAPTYRGRPTKDLAFVLRKFSYNGASLHLEWTDNSDGEGRFLIFRVAKKQERFIGEAPAGQLSIDLPIVLPAGYACYSMVVRKVTGEFGVSNQRCYDNQIGG